MKLSVRVDNILYGSASTGEQMTDTSGGVDASEDRELFERGTDPEELFVACGPGIARVTVAADRLGEFALAQRCVARGVTADGERVVAATDEGVFGLDAGDSDFERLGDPFEATAVGLDGDSVLAATADGVVARCAGEDWTQVGEVTGPRRFDGSLLAAADGVYRVGDTLDSLGLEGVRDCADSPVGLFAATDDGLSRFEDGWTREFDRPAGVVTTDGERVHATDEQGVLERIGGEWRRFAESDADTPVDIASGERLCAVTADGTVLVEADPDILTNDRGGWRTHRVGLQDAVALAVR
jgi:hypothetical protein